MLLSSFSYKTSGWELTEINALKQTNLLVGKNAAGKTRTIRGLQYVTAFLCMKPELLAPKSFKNEIDFYRA